MVLYPNMFNLMICIFAIKIIMSVFKGTIISPHLDYNAFIHSHGVGIFLSLLLLLFICDGDLFLAFSF